MGTQWQKERRKLNELHYEEAPWSCLCGNRIPYDRRERKSCSKACSKMIVGGIRKGAGQSKHGWYGGIWCDSLYELAFVMYHLDMGSAIERNAGTYRYLDENGQERTYQPDFIVNGRLYEIKGWLSERALLKAAAVTEQMTMIVGEDQNKPFIDHVKAKYGIHYERFVELYDESRHVAQFVCQACGKLFLRATNSGAMACSQVCSGKLAVERKRTKTGGAGEARTLIPLLEGQVSESI